MTSWPLVARASPITFAILGPEQISERLGVALWIQSLIPNGTSHVSIVPDLGFHRASARLVEGPEHRRQHPNAKAFACEPLESLLDDNFGNPEDRLAQAMHAEYERSRRIARHGDGSKARPAESLAWSLLDETFRQASRAAADHLPIKLRAVGRELVPLDDPREPDAALSAEQLESLARIEHDRWMAERLLNGWSFAPERDDRALRHNLLVPWEQLPEADRYIDRDMIQNAARAAERAGCKIVRRRVALSDQTDTREGSSEQGGLRA